MLRKLYLRTEGVWYGFLRSFNSDFSVFLKHYQMLF
jgi:hypothetical protein